MKHRKKMNRTGKFRSISIALATLLYFGGFSGVNAQEDITNSNESTKEVKDNSVDYHNLDYRYQNNQEFGKEDKLIEENDNGDNKPTGQMSGEKGNATENTYNSDSTDHDSLRHSYGLNQEIISQEPDADELNNNEKIIRTIRMP